MGSIITFPSGVNFSSYTLQLMRKTIILASPISGARQTIAQPYALWGFQGKFSQQVLQNAANLRAFFTQLDGQVNRFRLPIPEAILPQSGYTGNSGFVNGAGQTGSSLVTNGWAPNALVMMQGDYFTVNEELKVCVGSNYASDGSGNCTISFKPALRFSPPNNAQLRIGNPVNVLLYSQAQNNAVYPIANMSVAVGATDPTGSTGASTLTCTANGSCTIRQVSIAPNLNLNNEPATFSVWLKQGTYTGSVILTITDSALSVLASASVTPTTTWTRYTVSLPSNMSTYGLGCAVGMLTSTAGQTLLNYGWQLERAGAATTYKVTSTGDGVPTCLMATNDDNAASWDLSPPFEYQMALNAIEALS